MLTHQTLTLLVPASLLGVAAAIGTAPIQDAGSTKAAQGSEQLALPVRMIAGGNPIRTEAPGYAAPAWHDATGDGRPDLVVGQFNAGKMWLFESSEDGVLAQGTWMEAAGNVAKVPGVW